MTINIHAVRSEEAVRDSVMYRQWLLSRLQSGRFLIISDEGETASVVDANTGLSLRVSYDVAVGLRRSHAVRRLCRGPVSSLYGAALGSTRGGVSITL